MLVSTNQARGVGRVDMRVLDAIMHEPLLDGGIDERASLLDIRNPLREGPPQAVVPMRTQGNQRPRCHG